MATRTELEVEDTDIHMGQAIPMRMEMPDMDTVMTMGTATDTILATWTYGPPWSMSLAISFKV